MLVNPPVRVGSDLGEAANLRRSLDRGGGVLCIKIMMTKNANTLCIALMVFCSLFRPAVGQLAGRASDRPSLNGASVFAARPNHPFLYRIPATGSRPMQFSAMGLPPGLKVDSRTGMITGTVKSAGSTDVVLRASNAAGRSERKFRIVIGDQLALTPPMGWSSWTFCRPRRATGTFGHRLTRWYPRA